MDQARQQILAFANQFPSRHISKKRTIFYQGEVPRAVYVIRSGLVRLYNITNEGEEKTIGYEGPGSAMPSAWLFGMSPVTLYYYDAVNEVILHAIPRDTFRDKLDTDTHFSKALLQQYASLYVGSTMHINAIEQSRAQDKIVRILQYLVHRFGTQLSGDTYQLGIQFTHQDIANLIGSTRETVAIEFGKLTKKGYVSKKDRHYHVNLSILQQRIGEDEYQDLSL